MSHRQTIQFVKTPDNIRLAYGMSGSGPILVKCANWLNHLEFDWESPVWKHWFEFLSDHFTLIRYDERGCGLSDWNCDNATFESWVNDLEVVVEANELEKFPLLGISQGAAVAIEYSIRHPEKVSHLILFGGYAAGRRHRSEREIKQFQLALSMVEAGWDAANPAFREFFAGLFVPNGGKEHQTWFGELCRKTASTENALKIQNISAEIDVRSNLHKISVPTLVIHANKDSVVNIQEGRALATEIPGAQFVQLDSANHLLLPDEPAWQQFCDEVLHFLQDHHKQAPLQEPEKLELLTTKEKSILDLLGEGLSNSAIAEKAFLSEKTIRNHLTHIYDKLGVNSRAEAIVMTRSAYK